MTKKRILVEDDIPPMDTMQTSIDFCLAELLLRSDLLHSHTWNEIDDKPDFHDVAVSGDYDDLVNKPDIPSVVPQIQSDWNQSNISEPDHIKNKPTIPNAQIQSDWEQSDSGMVDFIKNKPVRSFSKPSRALNSAFLVNSARDCFVGYALNVTTNAALLLGARARFTLQYADNAAMSSNLVNVMESEGGTGSGIVVTSYHTLLVAGVIPAGKYVRLLTTNVQGSPTYGTLSTQEVAL